MAKLLNRVHHALARIHLWPLIVLLGSCPNTRCRQCQSNVVRYISESDESSSRLFSFSKCNAVRYLDSRRPRIPVVRSIASVQFSFRRRNIRSYWVDSSTRGTSTPPSSRSISHAHSSSNPFENKRSAALQSIVELDEGSTTANRDEEWERLDRSCGVSLRLED